MWEPKQVLCQLQDINQLAKDAADYAYCVGYVMRCLQTSNSSSTATHRPFAVLPSQIPRRFFDQAVSLVESMNQLFFDIANEHDFIQNSFLRCRKVTQKFQMAIMRSDYMINTADSSQGELKQVEVNTIACGLPASADKVRQIQEYTVKKHFPKENICFLSNKALNAVASALIHAWSVYRNKNGVIVFVVEESEVEIFDQRHLEHKIVEMSGIKVVRSTLKEVAEHGRLTANRDFILKKHVVSVVYYRTGYSPNHYNTEKEWAARAMLDVSNAINCPSVGLQLAGMKHMQKILAQRGVVETFLKDPVKTQKIKDVFVGFHSIDVCKPENLATSKAELENLVLKSTHEGGEIVYGAEMANKLKEIEKSGKSFQFILMDKIKPLSSPNVFVCNSDAYEVDAVSELGIFSYLLGL